MKQGTKIALLTATAGMFALGLTGLSVVRAAATDVDTEVTTATTPATLPARGPHGGERLEEMAKLLNMTTAELQTELQSGKEFYQIAAAHSVTYDQVKAQRDAEVKARLDDMVKVGYLTQAQADSQWTLHQTKSAEMPMLGFGGGRGHGFGR